MAVIDTYRNNVTRKKDELAKLSHSKSRESEKKSQIDKRIQSANRTIKSTQLESTLKMKLNEIARCEKQLTDIYKKISDIDKKIATKSKELNNEEKKLRKEEIKIEKKRNEDSKKRHRENMLQMNQLSSTLELQKNEQLEMKKQLIDLATLPEKITVLFLASNPKDTNVLRLDEEARTIREMITKSKHRDSVVFETRLAVRPLDILQAMNELNPEIIHFSGHGTDTDELVLEDMDGSTKFVSKEAIAQTIKTMSNKIRLVFFNTCFSFGQAEEVTKHIDSAIGMSTSIGDRAAIVFASSFYSAIGFGMSINNAFLQARAALMLEGIREEDTPTLYIKEGLSAEEIIIVRPTEVM